LLRYLGMFRREAAENSVLLAVESTSYGVTVLVQTRAQRWKRNMIPSRSRALKTDKRMEDEDEERGRDRGWGRCYRLRQTKGPTCIINSIRQAYRPRQFSAEESSALPDWFQNTMK
jgi:hypothetical protein